MSASNWTYCPNVKNHKGYNEDIDEYTFREDYEIYGAETGHLVVEYSGHCEEPGCISHLDFKEHRKIPVQQETLGL